VVDAKPGQQVVEISLATAGTLYSDEDFDRTVAGAWLGVSDLKVAAAYASSILNRAWGFHDQTLSTALHTAHTYLQDQIEDLKKITPSDAERKRIAEEVLQIAPNADKYIDLMTKAISEAQKANSWMGNPADMYAQARALETTITFPPDAVTFMTKSKSFKEALPVDRQVALGLATDPREFNLGAEYYQSTPNVIAVVVKGGLADDLGFKAGDRLVSASGQPVKSVWDLKLALRANAGKTVQVVLERQGKQQQRDVKVPAQLR
jgi:C-terminal processing protease CtpA/Prc